MSKAQITVIITVHKPFYSFKPKLWIHWTIIMVLMGLDDLQMIICCYLQAKNSSKAVFSLVTYKHVTTFLIIYGPFLLSAAFTFAYNIFSIKSMLFFGVITLTYICSTITLPINTILLFFSGNFLRLSIYSICTTIPESQNSMIHLCLSKLIVHLM